MQHTEFSYLSDEELIRRASAAQLDYLGLELLHRLEASRDREDELVEAHEAERALDAAYIDELEKPDSPYHAASRSGGVMVLTQSNGQES